ncbi:transposase [Actinokineospora auranticolor]|uniref:transposase n=1 Tax=Actinokineospora auranticolor TaxID=155976 RepID=UPI0011B0EB3E
MAAPKKYPDELRARAVRLYRESDPKPVVRRLAEQLGVRLEALRNCSGRTRPTAASVTAGPRPVSPTSCEGFGGRTRNSTRRRS